MKTLYNDVMEMKKMTFAPGWVQIIDPATEKQDLLTYINDTHKALYGYRPRFDYDWVKDVSLDNLRKEANYLEGEIVESIQQDKRDAHERMLEANRVAVLYRAAKKPVSRTFKPFANLKEILV